jgi:hypothetical protein
MPAQLRHSVRAKTPVVMLLVLLKAAASPNFSRVGPLQTTNSA